MKILALDAALGPFAAALDCSGTLRADRSAGTDALETGLQRVARLLAAADLRPAGLDRIAVGVGPGSFTGIRIAISYAKSLAYAAAVPLVGVSSYDILTPPDYTGPCLAIVNGRPGVVCARLSAGDVRSYACGAVADVFERLLAEWDPAVPLAVVTNAQDVLLPVGETSVYLRCLISPAAGNSAVALARLARSRVPAASPHGVTPDYGEIPAVTVPKARPRSAPERAR